MARMTAPKKGFLGRLRESEGGNVLVLTAASIVPLIAMIGGAVDMSRIYLIKTRLQQACDAGALAGRREMANSSWTTANETTAKNFFATNYPSGSYGTTGTTPTFTESNQVVSGTATVTVPMSMMKFFGFGAKTITVNCVAEMKIPNTDVMFVLDTTGSMASKANYYDTQTKIEALRSAVTSFYNALESTKGPNTRIRYGFVPYSVNVNVGFLLNRDWMVDSATYQSREPIYTGTYYDYVSGWTFVSGQKSSPNNFNGSCPASTLTVTTDRPAPVETTDFDGRTVTIATTTRTSNGIVYNCSGGNKTKTTYTQYVEKMTDTSSPRYTWRYRPIPYSVSDLKGTDPNGLMGGGSLVVPIGDWQPNSYLPSARTVDWDGCIEEANTNAVSNYSSLPADTNDLNIDLIPSVADDTTRWKPALPDLVFGRRNTYSGGSSWNTTAPYDTDTSYYTPNGPCPTTARKLDTINSTDLATYLNSLNPTGNTYHDIGMLWGARLISPDGIFGAENKTAPNGGQIARHIIFMTDGATEPNNTVYTPYGLEPLDRRRTTGGVPSNSTLTTVVNSRLAYLCGAATNKGITIWVVAFGTTLTSNLSSCAPGRAYQANNPTDLQKVFDNIAARISQLKLTQ